MNEPIIEFAGINQAYECLKEWQSRLFLNDWQIKIMLDDKLEDDGEIRRWNIMKAATIRIGCRNNELPDALWKKCDEATIVHELLHLYLDVAEHENPTIEQVIFEELQHQKVEELSKSFIMAKYGITADWFKNFKEE